MPPFKKFNNDRSQFRFYRRTQPEEEQTTNNKISPEQELDAQLSHLEDTEKQSDHLEKQEEQTVSLQHQQINISARATDDATNINQVASMPSHTFPENQSDVEYRRFSNKSHQSHSRYFQFSGIIGSGWTRFFMRGMLASLICGPIYGYLMYLIPAAFFRVIVCFISLFIFAVIFGAIGSSCKIRNTRFQFWGTWLCGLVGFYFCYCVWVGSWMQYLHFPNNMFSYLFDPSLLWTHLCWLADHASTKISNGDSSTTVWIDWGLEMVIFLWVSAYSSTGVLESNPYCENCQLWIDKVTTFKPRAVVKDIKSMQACLEASNYTALFNLPIIAKDSQEYTEIEVRFCNKCHGQYYLDVHTVKVKKDKNNKDTQEKSKVVHFLIIPAHIFSELQAAEGSL